MTDEELKQIEEKQLICSYKWAPDKGHFCRRCDRSAEQSIEIIHRDDCHTGKIISLGAAYRKSVAEVKRLKEKNRKLKHELKETAPWQPGR